MFRKTAYAVLTAAVVATSAVSLTTEASAKNGRNGALAAGAIFGLAAGAMIGAAANDRYYDRTYDRYDYRPRRHCWDKPVRRWDPYYQRKVVVGYRTVCR